MDEDDEIARLCLQVLIRDVVKLKAITEAVEVVEETWER